MYYVLTVLSSLEARGDHTRRNHQHCDAYVHFWWCS